MSFKANIVKNFAFRVDFGRNYCLQTVMQGFFLNILEKNNKVMFLLRVVLVNRVARCFPLECAQADFLTVR